MRIRMSASPLLGGAVVAIGPTPAPAPYDPLRFELSPPPAAAAAKDLAPSPAATSLCPRPPPAGSPTATSTNRRGTSWPSSTSRIPRLPTGLKLIQAGLPSKISPAPTMFSAPVPLPAENFDDGSTKEPEHPNMKENLLKESAPFLQEPISSGHPTMSLKNNRTYHDSKMIYADLDVA